MEQHLGRQVSGVVADRGGVTWSLKEVRAQECDWQTARYFRAVSHLAPPARCHAISIGFFHAIYPELTTVTIEQLLGNGE